MSLYTLGLCDLTANEVIASFSFDELFKTNKQNLPQNRDELLLRSAEVCGICADVVVIHPAVGGDVLAVCV